MKDDDIKAFARRPYSLVEHAKREYWARTHEAIGAAGFLDLGAELYRHARQVNPNFPTEQERREDLEHHVSLKRRLNQAHERSTHP